MIYRCLDYCLDVCTDEQHIIKWWCVDVLIAVKKSQLQLDDSAAVQNKIMKPVKILCYHISQWAWIFYH